MRIALVHCPTKHKLFSENLKVVDEEFCLAPPISLSYVASILDKMGHKVILVDAHALNLTKENTLGIVNEFSPDILGFRMDTYQFYETLEWIRYLKQNIGVPVVAGGINFLLYPKESLFHREIDYGIIGEAIESLPKLLLAIENNDTIDNIEGIVYRNENNGGIKINPTSTRAVDFNSYPFPARYLLPNEKYHSFISQRKNFTIMVTSKGCPYRCTFCSISKLPYLERSPKNIVDEIEECYREYNIKEIDIFDGVFFYNRNRVMEICCELLKRRIKIEWSCRSRVDMIDKELLETASNAGCRQIYYGIESGNPGILKSINKKVNLEQVKYAIHLSKNCGIKTLGFFMVGNPGETRDTVIDTIRLIDHLELDFVQVCRTIAKPGTELDRILIDKTGRDYWRDYIIGKVKEERISCPWTDLTQKEIENYVKKIYLRFYFRIQYILKTFLKIKSIDELYRYCRVAIKMFFYHLKRFVLI